MNRLLVLADDLTGALDTGVQFALGQADTAVFHQLGEAAFDSPSQVLVINTGTRNLDAGTAYDRAALAARLAKEQGFTRVYKKTDSGLRGNTGAELQAVLDVYGGALAFAPAHPKAGRVVKGGRLYVDGLPVSRSVFARDPYKPVLLDDVAALIALQSAVPVIPAADGKAPPSGGVWLFDAHDAAGLDHAARESVRAGCALFAGCAGFAEALMPLLGLERQTATLPAPAPPLFVVSGSVSEVSFRQLILAEAAGWRRMPVEERLLLRAGLMDSPAGRRLAAEFAERIAAGERMFAAAALSAGEAGRVRAQGAALGMDTVQIGENISRNLGALCALALRELPLATPALIGGDTLARALDALAAGPIRPLKEIGQGTVLSLADTALGERCLISKSGSFGGPDAIAQMEAFLRKGMVPPREE